MSDAARVGQLISGNPDGSEPWDAGALLDAPPDAAVTDAGAHVVDASTLDAAVPPDAAVVDAAVPTCTYPKHWCAAGKFCGYCPAGMFCDTGSTTSCADAQGCVYPKTWCGTGTGYCNVGGCFK